VITVVVPPADLEGERLALTGDTYRHLFRSRRVAADEPLRVVDGLGRARWASLESIGRDRAWARLGDAAPSGDPAIGAELFVALPKPDRAAWLVEKATELGAAAIRFVDFERSAREASPGGLDRLRRVAVAALEQCHGSRLPEIFPPCDFAAALTLARPGGWLLAPGGDRAALAQGAAQLWIGPEGGVSPAERQAALGAGLLEIDLGPRILRVETAAVVGLASLLGRNAAV
jgi:16S rRNA (uracil1498-N3)-methyltransferase